MTLIRESANWVAHISESLCCRHLAEKVMAAVLIPSILDLIGFVFDRPTAYLLLMVLVGLDVVTGTYRSFVRRDFTSRKFFHSVLKVVFYSVLISVCSLLVKINPAVFGAFHPDEIMLAFLAATEALSIMENVSSILGMTLPELLIDKLKSIVATKRKEEK